MAHGELYKEVCDQEGEWLTHSHQGDEEEREEISSEFNF